MFSSDKRSELAVAFSLKRLPESARAVGEPLYLSVGQNIVEEKNARSAIQP
ncbi:hypothetical protein [Telluria beijingensis]|uniref:hypothetical protein n=1 Tax=Telluria beijingensis TaxID=3068633 RepID=UPI0027963804|nr:hypothetical protein [Massilia sp. REN29]